MKKLRQALDNSILMNDKINILFIFIIQLIAFVFYSLNIYVSVVILLAVAIFEFFFYFYKTGFAFNLAGIFPSVWIFTYALNRLLLNSLYHNWDFKTWMVFILTPCFYLLGFVAYDLKFSNGHKIKNNLLIREYYFSNVYAIFKWVVFTGFIVVFLFLLEVVVLGFIPYFSTDMNAYVDFYIPVVHNFVVLSYFVPCMAIFYLFKLRKVGRYPEFRSWHKILVYVLSAFCIVVPILIVSRQNMFLLIFSCCFVYDSLNKKKNLKVFVAMGLLLVVSYFIISPERNQSVDYLGTIYTQPATGNDTGSADNRLDSLPSFAKTPYMYLTISDENFSRQVRDENQFTFGLRQLELPLKFLEKITGENPNVASSEYKETFQVNQYLNTFNLVSDFYMDFGIIGIIIEMMLLGMLGAFAQDIGDNVDNPIVKIGYSMISYILFFCYFAPWMSVFTIQFTVLLIVAILIAFVFFTEPNQKIDGYFLK